MSLMRRHYAIPHAEPDETERKPVESARADYPTARELSRWMRPEEPCGHRLPHDYIMRLLELRKQGRIGIVWAEQGAYYIGDHYRHEARMIPVEKLKDLIEHLERARDCEAMAS